MEFPCRSPPGASSAGHCIGVEPLLPEPPRAEAVGLLPPGDPLRPGASMDGMGGLYRASVWSSS